MLAVALLIAQTAAAVPAARPDAVVQAASQAAELCGLALTSRQMKLPAGTETYSNIPAVSSALKSIHSAPPIVGRFVATLPWRAIEMPTSYFRIPAGTGSMWIIPSTKTAACDAMLTGAMGPTDVDVQLTRMMEADGWQVVISRPANVPGGLAQHVLAKMTGTAERPNDGIRARIRALPVTSANKDGVQLEISFLAGELKIPAKAN